jgi:metal-dependent hydrolase (beta-lactamase superfamily II)
MKITVLTENTSHKIWCWAERWLSLLIEYWWKKILFDTWLSDMFLKNAAFLDVSLDDVDTIIFSHHHRDHVRWLIVSWYGEWKKIIVHPEALPLMKKKEAWFDENKYDFDLQKSAYEYAPGMWFLWEIWISNDFEDIIHKGERVFDDSAIAFDTSAWVVLFTWCSHSWIVNICEYAKKVIWKNLYFVMWGFHLFSHKKDQITSTIQYFKDENIPNLCPMHCVDFETQSLMHQELSTTRYAAGDIIILDV